LQPALNDNLTGLVIDAMSSDCFQRRTAPVAHCCTFHAFLDIKALTNHFWYVQEVEVNDEDIIQQLMEHSNANRSTGSTGANSESSRSHSIMQVAVQIV
jgi:hypothetical protein